METDKIADDIGRVAVVTEIVYLDLDIPVEFDRRLLSVYTISAHNWKHVLNLEEWHKRFSY